MKKFLVWFLVVLLYAGLTALYGGIGWVVAWILGVGLNIAVNYTVFVWVGIGLFWLKAIPLIIIKLFVDNTVKDIGKNTRGSGMKVGNSMKSILDRIEKENRR